MNFRPHTRRDLDTLLLAAVATAVSLVSFLGYFQRGEILLYGDAIAHINIARRVFDSQTPGLLQLGTVWLPLPHLLMIPFLLSDWLWRSGVGGSIPSMVAYVFGVIGMFRLLRGVLQAEAHTQSGARAGAWIAAAVYGLNPNLLYLQTTAMTEAVYLALFVWATVFLGEWLKHPATTKDTGKSGGQHGQLWKCAACVAAAELTRYDGWFLGAAVGAVAAAIVLRRWRDRAIRMTAAMFMVAVAAAPLLWLAYNAAAYGDALEFARGPYSAQAIEQKTAQPGYPAHPGSGNLLVAGTFFLKSAELTMAPGNWGRIWVAIVVAALIFVRTRLRSAAAVVFLLWTPLLFYALSIAYGGVPLFLPPWWPHTWYNIRYGLQFLPLFAISAAIVAALAPQLQRAAAAKVREHVRRFPAADGASIRNLHTVYAGAIVVLVGISYFLVVRSEPLCFTEAWVNSRTKLALEASVSRIVSGFPPSTRYLMYVGDHVGVFQQAGVPLLQVVNEGNHRPWKKPSDPEGLWERALADPAKYADVVIAYDGDAVDREVEKKDLTLFTEIHTTGQPPARVYLTRSALNRLR